MSNEGHKIENSLNYVKGIIKVSRVKVSRGQEKKYITFFTL